jgi:hypothetical protein
MKRVISYCVFLTVASIVSLGFSSIIRKSISDHSNYEMISEVINSNHGAVLALNKSPHATVLGASTEKASIPLASKKYCPPSLISSYTQHFDIYTYLKQKNLDSSFNFRQSLANFYGITNYKGTSDQNSRLVGLLASNEICQTSNQ